MSIRQQCKSKNPLYNVADWAISMSEYDQIESAIASLEAQRLTLGDAVVDTTVAVLREKLNAVNGSTAVPHAQAAQRKQVTILFANITGFTGLAESLPDTNLLDIMNILWRRLDEAITDHGGSIDKHMGDAVMGLFGVPVAHEDDPERAVRAALTMRALLSDFLDEMRSQNWADLFPDQEEGVANPLQNLHVRIGINTGPVMLGDVGSGAEVTVIGDAVNVASRLERAAPSDGIYISHDTYLQVREVFNVEPMGLVNIRGRSEPIQVYLVLGAKPRLFYETGRGVEGVETRMIGREQELHRLILAYEQAVREGKGQVITIVGESGVGKTRLLHEFNNWLKVFPEETAVLKGRTYQHVQQLPYALIRDMISTYFGIQDNDAPAVAEEKLLYGMGQVLGLSEADVRPSAQALAQLMGLDLTRGERLLNARSSGEQLQTGAYEYVAGLFEALLTQHKALLLILEDVHWSDPGSLDLIRYLARLCQTRPLLLLSITRPFPPDEAENGRFPLANMGEVVELKPLSEQESHELVLEILRKLPEIPIDLADLIVERAGGNPFYVEELIKVLIEDGVIVAGEDEWQLRRNQLTGVRVPPNITGVLQARLDRLATFELTTLQKAAVVGRLFWDNALIHMNQTAVDPLTEKQTRAALQALEKRELIFQRQISGFTGSTAYVFKHAILHQVAYESVLLRVRPTYHRQAADWLAQQSSERIGEYAGLIAEHYELAGEEVPAAELYEISGNRAREARNLELAIDHFRRALGLISEKTHMTAWQLRLQEELGTLLQQQARLIEAAQVYLMMRFTAEEDGDLAAQARASNGLAAVQAEQGQYESMLTSATQAEQVAWLVNAESTLVRTLLYKSEAQMHLGDLETAVATTTRALSMSERPDEPEAMTLSLKLLVGLTIRQGRYEQATQYLEQLKGHLALLDVLGETREMALAQLALGQLHMQLGQYEQAHKQLQTAVDHFREFDDQPQVADALNALAQVARLRGDAEQAVILGRDAINLALYMNDRRRVLAYQTNLGMALVNAGQPGRAEAAFDEVVRQTENISRMAGWHYLPLVHAYQARAYLAQGRPTEALRAARKAHQEAIQGHDAHAIGIAWRTLGIVLTQTPTQQKRLQIGTVTYEATDCLERSVLVFKEANGGGTASYREMAYSLWLWAEVENGRGHSARAQDLRDQADALARALDITLPDTA